jgi:predicted metal-binding membrane protein
MVPRAGLLTHTQPDALESAQRRDRGVVLGALLILTLLSWYYTVAMALDMDSMLLPQAHAWSRGELAMLFIMWVVMMVAMMLPSVTPTVLMFSRMRRAKDAQPAVLSHTAWFVLGYLAAWTAFSFAVTLLQWRLHTSGVLSPMMASSNARFGAALLLLAGVFQLTSLKHACLARCRSPLGFIMTQWREGARGAFVMGWRHGVYCVGCCWALMVLLFVTGVMNLLWIALISVFVLLEKIVPAGPVVARVSGTLLIIAGLWMFFLGSITASAAL